MTEGRSPGGAATALAQAVLGEPACPHPRLALASAPSEGVGRRLSAEGASRVVSAPRRSAEDPPSLEVEVASAEFEGEVLALARVAADVRH